MLTFTDTQKLACDISRNIAITAGAGSGKTRVLVERYLWCLRNNGYQVKRVVAITFTEKAAGEMLSRIRQRVMEYAAGAMGDPQRWQDVLETLPLAHISTIHSFCQRLLREFPIEAGVDPNFDVIDETLNTIRLTHLIDALIQQRNAANDEDLRLLADIWSPMSLRAIVAQLLKFRSKALPWARGILQEEFEDYWAALHNFVSLTQERGIRRLSGDQQWKALMNDIAALIPAGDRSKLTFRCQNILDYDQEFRQQSERAHQLTTLAMLQKELRMITPSKLWKAEGRNTALKEIFSQLKVLYEQHLPELPLHKELEQSGFRIQQALARLVCAAHDAHQQDKRASQALDFDDLQERTLDLLAKPEVQRIVRQRYDYVMVDEFQDTNQMQWDIIKALGMTQDELEANTFCVVGDEKQSIYMFRGAEVSVFADVRRQLQAANQAHHLLEAAPNIPGHWESPQQQPYEKSGELMMAENFRSDAALVFFFNALFARLFLPAPDSERPYDVPHQELIAANVPPSSEQAPPPPAMPVEFLLLPPDIASDGAASEQAERVARRIQALRETSASPEETSSAPAVRYGEMAILLRTRTRLKEFEAALRRADIPFVVAGGIGFYQQQEIYDLANVLRVLCDQRQDIALTGVLRSPLFSLSDDQLFFLSTIATPDLEDESDETSPASQPKQANLWAKLAYLAETEHEDMAFRNAPAPTIPEELEPADFFHAYQMLNTWKTLCNRVPITHLLHRILEDTSLYGILANTQRDVQGILNIEKLLDLARDFEREGLQSLHDFVLYLDELIATEDREGEAQMDLEAVDAVKVMTIHAAKGLEFPIVFLPELERPFNYGYGDPVYLDVLPLPACDKAAVPVAAGVKGINPEAGYEAENTVFREALKRLNVEKTDAEMKRVLYVACTRAQTRLIFAGALQEKVAKHSWLAWLLDIFPLQDAIESGSFTLTDSAASEAQDISELVIPVHAGQEGESRAAKKLPAGDVMTWLHAPDAPDDSTADLIKTLYANIEPVATGSPDVFVLTPSALQALFRCPQLYYYKHILRLDEALLEHWFGPSDQLVSSESVAASQFSERGAQRGTIIHELFEHQYFDCDADRDTVLTAITTELDRQGITPQERRQMRLMPAIERAYDSYRATGLHALLRSSPQVYREYQFQLRLQAAHVAGILDMLFRDPDTHIWTILDYKTNAVSAAEVPEEVLRHGYDRQMQMYALAVTRLFQVQQVRSILFFTSPGVLYDAIDLSPAALRECEAELTSLLTPLYQEQRPIPQVSAACEECEYRRYEGLCPA